MPLSKTIIEIITSEIHLFYVALKQEMHTSVWIKNTHPLVMCIVFIQYRNV